MVGYLIYEPSSRRIKQIATHPEFRKKGIATELVLFLRNQFGSAVFILNIEKNYDPMISFLKKIGLNIYLEQLEMKMEIL